MRLPRLLRWEKASLTKGWATSSSTMIDLLLELSFSKGFQPTLNKISILKPVESPFLILQLRVSSSNSKLE